MPKDTFVSPNHRPLLPATQAVPSPNTSQPQPPAGTPATTDAAGRRQLTVACETCRRRKSKCDGGRPSCRACVKRCVDCFYEAGPGETRSIALKRNFRSLENDRAELDELLYLMRSRSEPEAIGILQHFRSEPDASTALKLERDGELLLQAFRDANGEKATSISARPSRTTSTQDGKSGVAQVTPSDTGPNAYQPGREILEQHAESNESNSSLTLKRKFSSVQGDMDQLLALLHYIQAAPETENGDLAMQQYLNSSWTERDNDGHLQVLDATAMRQSPIKVPSRPWTNVAGDGIVSHLVSIFFDQEQQFLMPYVDKKIFLADMALGDRLNSQFCSPLLVNSICALSAFTSTFVRTYDRACDGHLRMRFYDEARKLLDNEQGRPSLTTAQALLFLFVYNSASATDRAGSFFRFAGCEMFKRLRLGANSVRFGDTDIDRDQYRAARARNAWGMFFVENQYAFAYLQPSLIPVPTIPRYFLARQNVVEQPSTYVKSENVLDLQCTLGIIFYRAMNYCTNPIGKLGQSEDLQTRSLLYDELLEWERAIPPLTQFEVHSNFLYSFLRAYFHVVGIVIFRPLLSIDVGVPETGRSPASLCIYHCDGILEHMRSLKVTRPVELVNGSVCILNLCYMCVFTLISILDIHLDARALFSEACEHLAKLSAYWPAAEAILKGAEALSQQLRLSLPRESLPHFTSRFLWPDPSDVPVSWNIPRYEEIADVLSEEGSFDVDDPTYTGIDLGKLIGKWNSTTIQS